MPTKKSAIDQGIGDSPERTIAQEMQFRHNLAGAFSPNAPVDEKSLFAGRISQVSELLRTINQKGQHAVLYGERGVGKTSIANVLVSFIPTGVFAAPRINCDGADTFDTVWRKVLDEIILMRTTNATGFAGVPAAQPFKTSELLAERPATAESVRRALTTIAATGVHPIVIIDEFDRLRKHVKRQMADTIKTLSDHAVNATVILVGVADSVSELIEEHASVERALKQVLMPRMTNNEIKKIITIGLERVGMTIDNESLNHIVLLAQGLPHYAHLLGLHAASIAFEHEVTEIDSVVVDQAIKRAIDSAQQTIRTLWHTATSSPRKESKFAEVLIACALAGKDEMGYFAAQDVRDPLRSILKKSVNIPVFVSHLADFSSPKRGGVLDRAGETRKYRYRFSNPLFPPFVVMQGFSLKKIPS